MKILVSEDELNSSPQKSYIPFECEFCNKNFCRFVSYVRYRLKIGQNLNYCSRNCASKARTRDRSKMIPCAMCGEIVKKWFSEYKNTINNFCSKKCSATHNNLFAKKKGKNRSILEQWIEKELRKKYSLELICNDRTIINAELDFYFPAISFAVELNGIFHYEPIFGKEKLNKVKNNDSRKFQACIEKQIELCVIDSTSLKYFKEEKARKFLEIITNIIDTKILEM